MKKPQEVLLEELRREIPSAEIWVIQPESILVMVVAAPLEEKARKTVAAVRSMLGAKYPDVTRVMVTVTSK